MCPHFCFYEVPQKTRYAFCTDSINIAHCSLISVF